MTRIVVTGAAGFIGSNIIKGLNARGLHDIIAVDDLTQGDKFQTWRICRFQTMSTRMSFTTTLPTADLVRSRRCSMKEPAATPWR